MKYKVIIRPEAENDLKEAFSWYEDKRLGLGYDFLLQIDAALRFIERNPEIHSSEYKETRKHLIKRFPYKIIYISLTLVYFCGADSKTNRHIGNPYGN